MSHLSQQHGSRSHVLGILAALGGRWGWRWWFPAVVWVFRAVIGRIILPVSPDPIPIDTAPAGWFFIASLAALLLLWGWGSRFALSLGYRRAQVFVTTAVAAVLLLAAVQLLASVANQIELAIVGAGGARVFALGINDKFGSDSGVFYPALAASQIYFVPLAIGLVLALYWTMRWSVVGMVAGLVTAAALIVGMLSVWAVTDNWLQGSQLLSGFIAMGLCVGVMLALAWIAYRRVPV